MTVFHPGALSALGEGGSSVPIPSQRLPCVSPSGADEPLTPPYRCCLAPHCLQEEVQSPVFIVFRVLQVVHPPASQNTSCHSPAGPSPRTFHARRTACALCGAWTPRLRLVGSAS